jgi:ketosteroid isomerase-like protein
MKAMRVAVCAAAIGFCSLSFVQAAKAGGQEGSSAASSDVKELIELDQKWVEAAAKHDTAYLNQLFTDDFFEASAGSGGEISNKQQLFKKVTAPERKVDSITVDDIKVHLYGDSALVTDRTIFKGSIGGRDVSGNYRVLRVFVKQQGRWRAAGAELCRMAPSVYTSIHQH